jgi:hypothetical protein
MPKMTVKIKGKSCATQDLKFWRLLRAGDHNGLEGLYLHFAQDLFKYGMAISKDRDMVKDAIHELLPFKLWEKEIGSL